MITQCMLQCRRFKVVLQICLWRFGWIWLVEMGLIAGALVFYAFVLPEQLMKLDAVTQELKAEQTKYLTLNKTSIGPAPLSDEEGVIQQLNEQTYAEPDVGMLLQLIAQIAQAKGLTLSQSEFQTIQEGRGGLRQLQMTLPVRASYIQIRQFVQEILHQLGGVSVDQISIKRENVSQNQLDAKIKLSIWIDVSKQVSRVRTQP